MVTPKKVFPESTISQRISLGKLRARRRVYLRMFPEEAASRYRVLVMSPNFGIRNRFSFILTWPGWHCNRACSHSIVAGVKLKVGAQR